MSRTYKSIDEPQNAEDEVSLLDTVIPSPESSRLSALRHRGPNLIEVKRGEG